MLSGKKLKRLLARVYKTLQGLDLDRIAIGAGALAYFTVVTIAPSLWLITAASSLIPDPLWKDKLTEALKKWTGIIPADVRTLVEITYRNVEQNAGTFTLLSLLIGYISASGLIAILYRSISMITHRTDTPVKPAGIRVWTWRLIFPIALLIFLWGICILESIVPIAKIIKPELTLLKNLSTAVDIGRLLLLILTGIILWWLCMLALKLKSSIALILAIIILILESLWWGIFPKITVRLLFFKLYGLFSSPLLFLLWVYGSWWIFLLILRLTALFKD